jgi:hypothetical protein
MRIQTLALGIGALGLIAFIGCAGSGSTTPPPPVCSHGAACTVSNVLPGTVTLSAANNVNIFYVTIVICVPGTTTCQSVPNVAVDTGSSGLRLLSSAITLPLITQTDNLGNQVGNCVQFADLSYAFGPVKMADIVMGGNVAQNQPIQVIGASSFFPTPSNCRVPGGSEITNLSTLGANGSLGLGLFRQDCGSACASSVIPGTYYSCAGGSCASSKAPLSSQLQNPVWRFSSDNNGVMISLPAIPAAGQQTVQGSLILGIGTQANNALGTAHVYTTNSVGNITTTYNGLDYPSFIDSGSNGLFFLDGVTTSLTDCLSATGFYCPATQTNFTVVNTGANSVTGSVNFSVGNAETLFSANPSFAAFNDLGGAFPGAFDFGMPFFFGKNVFFGIEGQTVGSTVGPLYAY